MTVTSIPTLQKVQQALRSRGTREDYLVLGKRAAWALGGFFLSGASLGNFCQSFPLGLVLCAPPGWPAVLAAAGGALGYPIFWGKAGIPGLIWLSLGLLCSLALSKLELRKSVNLLPAAAAGIIVASTDLVLLLQGLAAIPAPMYLLRIGVSLGCTWLFDRAGSRRDVFTLAMLGFVGVLSLCQAAITSWFCLGFAAAAAVSAWGTFPAAALAGLALDLGQVTAVPMTAVLCSAFLLRLIPGQKKWFGYAAPALAFAAVAALCGRLDVHPLLPLAAGGGLAAAVPHPVPAERRRGETAVMQVKLELAAGVFDRARQVLGQMPLPAQDSRAMVESCIRSCCEGCPCRAGCKSRDDLLATDPGILNHPWISREDLQNGGCRKAGRVVAELRRTQENLRRTRREHARLREARAALGRQYRFTAAFLRRLSDELAAGSAPPKICFRAEIAARTRGKEAISGDRCIWFGVGNRVFVVLCDGLGTGQSAADASREACEMLRELLTAGYPADAALGCFNDLCVLRGAAGFATADLAEIRLDTGAVTLYKWGAAPSYLLAGENVQKIGTAAPPPGLSVGERGANEQRLSLGHGETLVLLTDGAEGEATLRRLRVPQPLPPGVMAERILGGADACREDDATAVVVRLHPISAGT